MYDYLKGWIDDQHQIEKVLNKVVVDSHKTDINGVLLSISGHYKNFEVRTLNKPYRLEITGSIHKYWNRGTNENDFSHASAKEAILQLCVELDLNPCLVSIINLEFGVNINPTVNASELIEQIICYNYLQPLRPYENRPDYYFIEFEQDEYFLKCYDKGKQYSKVLPGVPNTMRLEVKGMNSRFIMNSAGIRTMADLMQPDKMQVLGMKFAKLLKGLVFDDDTINTKDLSKNNRKLYSALRNPKSWKKLRGNTTSTTRNNINRFKQIVEQYGQRKVYSLIAGVVKEKILHLTKCDELAVFHPNYSMNNGNNQQLPVIKRYCLSCSRDISHQHPKSKYCSAKYVGYSEAHKCRNHSSNPRNNLKRKIAGIERKAVLFDIMPYIVEKKNKGKRA